MNASISTPVYRLRRAGSSRFTSVMSDLLNSESCNKVAPVSEANSYNLKKIM